MENKETTWEQVVSQGLEARASQDNAQWVIGDLAVIVVENFGTEALDKYAIEIGYAKSTLARYRNVSLAWDIDDRVDYLSHRHHMVLSKLDDKTEWLDKAHDNNWTIEQLKVELARDSDPKYNYKASTSITLTMDEMSKVVEWGNTYLEKTNDKDKFNLELLGKVAARIGKFKKR